MLKSLDICIDSFRFKGVYELDIKNGQKLQKFTHLTFKYDLLTFKITPGGVENGVIELAVLKIPYMDLRSCH